MARRKEDLLDRLLNSLSLRGIMLHPGTLFLVGTGMTILGALHLWEKYQQHIIPPAAYQLTQDKIQITPPPAWAKIDLKRLLLDRPAGHPAPSILDTDVVAKTAARIESVGWVEEVEQIRKTADGLEVDLRYRQPVGMVELNHTNIPAWGKSQAAQVMPVDRGGVIMPPELLAQVSLPRISIFQPQHFDQLTTWTAWPDARITAAAAILELLGPEPGRLGVYRVMTLRSSDNQQAGPAPYELWPSSGTQVIWGNAPGKESVNEATAHAKLGALLEFVTQHGPLDKMVKRKVDLRSGSVIIAQDAHVAKNNRIFADLK